MKKSLLLLFFIFNSLCISQTAKDYFSIGNEKSKEKNIMRQFNTIIKL
ncbi:MAG TPA: hypothetical protein VIR55_07195 [Ignavibacteria bacterium]